jgi:cytochrome c oxidase subunit I+III
MADIPYQSPPPAQQGDSFEETWVQGQQNGPFDWLRAVNNGPIGRRFLLTGFAFFLIGGIQSLLMRSQLARPESGLISPELYNQLFTMHGSTMLFLFVVPILEGLATLVGPTMLGTRDLPFPRLTAFSYWCYLFGGILMYSSFFLGMAPNGGWFAYVPLTGLEYSPGYNMDFWLLGLELAEASGIISALELIIAALCMRAPGMTLAKMPIFIWAMLVASCMILFAFMTVLVASLYLELDRKAGTQFFNIDAGGSALLWQHLFWFFGHPEVYIQFLPAAGIISTVIPAFARRPLASYGAVVLAFVATGFLSFGLWAHHMFTVGLPDITASFFSAASIVIAIPTGLQFFVWIATIWRGQVVWKTPMLFSVGFLIIFLIGGLSGVMVGVAPFDWQVHDSYFVVAHFHYVMIGGVVFPLLAGFYYWLPKITGRMLGERLGKWNFWFMFVGFNVGFFPMHITGFLGMPRRVYTYQDGIGWWALNLISTIGAFTFAFGILLFLINVYRSNRNGKIAGDNPWGGATLEWSVSSPPPAWGFRRLPIVDSRYPLWEQKSLAEGDETTKRVIDLLTTWPTTWQGAIVSDTFTGRIKEVFWLPNTSLMPVTTAFGLALSFGALIFDIFWLGAVGLVIAFIAYLVWIWPDNQDATHDHAVEAKFRELGVQVYTHSSPTIARYTLVLTLAIAAVTLGTMLFTFFFLGLNAPTTWPPVGVNLSELTFPLMALGLFLASNIFVAGGSRGRKDKSLPRPSRVTGFGIAFLLAVVATVLQVIAYASLEFSWRDHAFGSIFFLLAGFQLFMILTTLVMSSVAMFRLGLNREADEIEWVRVTAKNAALTWYVTTVMYVIVFFTLYLSPGML